MHDPATCRNGDHYGQCSGASLPFTAPAHDQHEAGYPGCPCAHGAACVIHGEEGPCEDCGALPDEPCGVPDGEVCILWK